MYKSHHKKEEGFTIIEVVLVLAIAGLIFLIVFLALPQLQASRRDTQRKNDAGRLVAALENWAGNHSGNYPSAGELDAADGATWVSNNVSGTWDDPSTGAVYVFVDSWSATMTDGQVDYSTGVSCNTTADGYTTTGAARDVAVVMALENGQYCQDNQ